MKKKCKVNGCNHKATDSESGKGIYSGVYLEWNFPYCNRHSTVEIEKSQDDFLKKLISKFDKCVNSYRCVYNELGKTLH